MDKSALRNVFAGAYRPVPCGAGFFFFVYGDACGGALPWRPSEGVRVVASFASQRGVLEGMLVVTRCHGVICR